MFLRLGAGVLPPSTHWIVSEALTPDSFKPLSTLHRPGLHRSPVPPSTALWYLCVSALVDLCPSPVLLRSTLMFNPILTVSSFSPRSRSASHEYPKVCLLDRIILLFKASGDNSSTTKTHSMDLLLSRFVSSAFFYSPSLFVPLGCYQTHWSTRSSSSSAALHRLLGTHKHQHTHDQSSSVSDNNPRAVSSSSASSFLPSVPVIENFSF